MDRAEQYTADWFSGNIDNWTRWLAEFKGRPDMRCLEVGSYEGRSAVWLLKNILTGYRSTIDCHDVFYAEDYTARFEANIAPWRDRVRVHRGYSTATLRHPADTFDFCYIDGDHTPLGVLTDAALAWPSLKVGAVMIFDDYLWLPPHLELIAAKEGRSLDVVLRLIAEHPAESTRTGIDAFLGAITGHYEVIEQAYQVAVQKTS